MKKNDEMIYHLIHQKMSLFNYDYFFHYLLIHSDKVRLFLCRYISQDDSIFSTTIVNSETFHPHYKGKKLILDIVCQDDQGRFYDFEMQNYDIKKEDQIRLVRYGERLVTMQEQKGIQLKHMKQVYQLVFYTGRVLKGFERYRHDIRKADEQENMTFQGDRVKTVLLQLGKIEEEFDMEAALQPMEQLGYLFYENRRHEKGKEDEIVREVIEVHRQFIDSEAYWEAYTYELEQALIEAKRERARDEGKKEGEAIGIVKGENMGIVKGKKEMLITLLQEKFTTLSKEVIELIHNADNEQLDKLSIHIFKMTSEEDIVHILNL